MMNGLTPFVQQRGKLSETVWGLRHHTAVREDGHPTEDLSAANEGNLTEQKHT
jgi:hypothetical protein